MRVLFMGTPSYATTILKELIDDEICDVIAVVTQPDKPVGRKQILTPPDVKRYILEHDLDIKVYQPEVLDSDEIYEELKKLDIDFMIVAAYGQILSKRILSIATPINLHASILPKYRGASPIQDAILSGDRYSGVTAMLMDEGLDSGDILAFSYLNIDGLNSLELFEMLSKLAAKLTIDVLKNFHKIKPMKQNSCDKSYSKKIVKADGLLKLKNAKEDEAKYRAFIFWPGVYLESGLKLKELFLEDSDSRNSRAEILYIDDSSIIIGCETGSLRVTKVQPPSKKEMSVVDYIRGKRLGVGDYLS